MNLSDFDQSKYLAGRDLPEGGLVATIAGFEIVDLKDGSKKPAVKFLQGVKPLLLNKTNRGRLAKIFGTDDTQAMVGQRIAVYYDPDVSFGGETVGGLRVRAAPAASRPAAGETASGPQPVGSVLPQPGAINPATGKPYGFQAQTKELDDEIPF